MQVRYRIAIGSFCALCCAIGLAVPFAADAPGAAADEAAPTFEVPFADDITIDGKDTDWRQVGIDQGRLPAAQGQIDGGPEDLDARLFLAWSYEGLLVLVRVRDDAAFELPQNAELYLHDSVELFMVNGAEKVQYIIAPGIAEGANGQRVSRFEHRRNAELQRNNPLKLTAVSAKTDDGYLVEALLPWEVLAIDPVIGTELRVQVMVNDADSPQDSRTIYAWHPQTNTHRDNSSTQRIRLAPTRHHLALLQSR